MSKKNTVPEPHPFRDIRAKGVPLCAWNTQDPEATIKGCIRAMNGKQEEDPVIEFDIIRGPVGRNDVGRALVSQLWPEPEMDLVAVLAKLCKEPVNRTVILAHTPGDLINNPQTTQAIWNCRDVFESNGMTLVMLATDTKLPAELKSDVVVYDDESPDEEAIGKIVTQIVKDAKLPEDIVDKSRVTDALLGFGSEFAVRQNLALAIRKTGVDMEALFKLKVQAFKQQAGLELSLPRCTFADLAATEGFKAFAHHFKTARQMFRMILWFDELEKMIAGTQDTSGTTQALLEQFLSWTESSGTDGVVFLGIPGAGKSRSAQCLAGELGIPLGKSSMSTVKNMLVGQSEQQMKSMLKTVDSIGQGRVLMVATCNSYENLPPEVLSRFKLGVFFYDYPNEIERAAIWKLYMDKYELTGEPPPSLNWVGREIESCCKRAWMFNIPLAEAAKSVVPVCQANAAKMETLRKSAAGRFLSAARPGVFQMEQPKQSVNVRRIETT